MLKHTITLLTILCLSGCRSVNTKLVCSQIETHQIQPIKSCDVSFKFNRCRCRCFNMNAWEELPLKTCPEFSEVHEDEIRTFKKKSGEKYEAVNYPVESCEGVSGPTLEDSATKVRPQVKALNRLKENLCE